MAEKKNNVKLVSGRAFLEAHDMLESQANFNVWWNPHEAFSSITNMLPVIGEIGRGSKKFKDRAFEQMNNSGMSMEQWQKQQDSYIEEDWKKGDPGREKHRAYRRMEYDFNPRTDGIDPQKERKEAQEQKEVSVKDLKDMMGKHYWINTLTTAVSEKPIEKKDYERKNTDWQPQRPVIPRFY